jgi:hypothetical protein
MFEMRVCIDHLDALATDGDLAPLRRGTLLRPRETALRHEAAGRGRRKSLDEITTIAHGCLLQLVDGVDGSVKSINVSDVPPPQFGLPPATYTA